MIAPLNSQSSKVIKFEVPLLIVVVPKKVTDLKRCLPKVPLIKVLPSICKLLILILVQSTPLIVKPLSTNSQIEFIPVGGGRIEKFDLVKDKVEPP